MAFPCFTRGARVVLVLCVVSVSQADQPQLAPQPGVLVLRGGRVLRGEIVRVGDRYVVSLGGKDELGVPADSVELQCDTLESAYQRRRDALPRRRTAGDHLTLADWCLRYDLLVPAAEQLMAAQQLEPDNPAAAAFERRLRLAAQRPSPPKSHSRPPRLVPQTDLDQSVRRMPAGTVEQFTNVIQPLLINRCGASGCHGPNGSSSFRLTSPNWSRTLPRRFTQQNLQATMQHVNVTTPADSPLLVNATSAHGTCTCATLGERDVEQLDQLLDWVRRCTSGRTPSSQLGQFGSTQPQPAAPATGGHPPAVAAGPPVAAPADGPTQTARSASSGDSVASQPPAARTDHPAGQDPFDPEIFNRRYLRRGQ